MIEKLSSLPFIHWIKHKSFQNFIFLAVIQSSNVLISLISMPLLITSIGVDQFGLVNLALSVIILANIWVGFGYNLSGPREVAINQKNKLALSHSVSNIIFSKVFLATLATVVLLISIFGFGLFKEYQVILAFSVMLLFSEATLPLWFFQGMEKMKLISISNVFSKLLYLMGIVLFIHNPVQAKWVNFLLGISAFSINILLLLYIHFQMQIRFYKPDFRQIYESLRNNLLLFLSNFASHIAVNGGLIILSFYATAEILGNFSLAERITMVLRIFPALVIQAIYPNASRLMQQGIDEVVLFVRKIYGLALLGGLILAIVFSLASPYIITLLSKSHLPEAVSYLQLLAFVPLFACLNIVNVLFLLITDQKTLFFKSSWLVCVYMIIASIILTQHFGPIGLCIALLSTELVSFVVNLILLRKTSKAMVSKFYNSLLPV
ncbi:oligosaccharide flippase family protein [Litoribacter alkaliphilus]|uniref:Oligosaccharide flippase family protein n=1 Tax=Litoribacter ruber TaxID=702568 RepID=A0AAP2G4H0_9BACT|nr:oligosaccharide flippase family protein [Litoribacter alkaliphilus]MBS9523448.1 oligosaccharide flippase family protein [Litoribacter alkaliphilus]